MKGRILISKILILHHSGDIGGAGASLLHILESLKNLGYELEVICPQRPNHMVSKMHEMDISVIPLKKIAIREHYSGLERNFLNVKNLKNYINLRRFKEEFRRILIESQADLVILNSMTLSYLGETVQKLNKKVICFHRETYANGTFGIRTKIIKNELINNFDKVVFISQFDKEDTGDIKNKGMVIYDKVKLAGFNKETSFDNKPFTILYVGGISKLKGAHVILNAISKLEINYKLIFLQYNLNYKRKKRFTDCKTNFERIKFILGFDYTRKILKIIDKNNLWSNIDFYKSQHNIEEFYNKSDVVVFPSMSPHQARPVYEAGAVGNPIVITKSNNIKEFVIDYENGLLFKEGNHKQLANQLMELGTNFNLAEQMGEKNHKKTFNNHNYNNLAKELNELLSTLI